MKSLVLLSGGIDSAVVLAMTMERGPCEAVLFDYGQPHLIELEFAERIAAHYGVPTRRITLPTMPLVNDVVFAGRNLVLAAHAVSIAAADKFDAVALGCNQSDWDQFSDCRPAFWSAFNSASGAYGVHVMMPLLRMTKAEVVLEAKARGIPIAETWTCYAPRDRAPCGECLACQTRIGAGA